MNLRVILILFIFLLWCLLAVWWYHDRVICNCQTATAAPVVTDSLKTDSSKMKKLADSPKIVAKPDSTTSVKSHDTLLVYFPVNSTNDNLDNQTLTHIKEIISEATKSGKSIQITGHSDSQGPADKNLVLGLKRANRLKDLFIEKGVQEGRIKVFSKGQTQPIGDNATAEGRAKNRRAEVVLN